MKNLAIAAIVLVPVFPILWRLIYEMMGKALNGSSPASAPDISNVV